MPALNDEKDILYDQVLSIQKWREEKLQSLKKSQEAYRLKLDAEKKRLNDIIDERTKIIMSAHKAKDDCPPTAIAKSLEHAGSGEPYGTAPAKPSFSVQQMHKESATSSLPVQAVLKESAASSLPVQAVLKESATSSVPVQEMHKESAALNLPVQKPNTVSATKSLPSYERRVRDAELIPATTAQRGHSDLRNGKEQVNVASISDKISPKPHMTFEETIEMQLTVTAPEPKGTAKPKPKQPFLKKGSGLQRYTTSYALQKRARKKSVKSDPKPELKPPPEKSAFRQADVAPKGYTVHFNSVTEEIPSCPAGSSALTTTQSSKENTPDSHPRPALRMFENEAKELAEFERLEHAVQNEGNNVNVLPRVSIEDEKEKIEKLLNESSMNYVDKSQLLELISRLNSERQRIERDLEQYSDNRDKNPSQLCVQASSGSVVNQPHTSKDRFLDNSQGGASNAVSARKATADLEALRSKLTSKMRELDEEIATYRANNAKLEELARKREEEIKALDKRRAEFEQSIEEERKKVDAEIAEKRQQIKREKQTFDRYQKLRKDMPGRKERDEINDLKQQMAVLQEELKKQSIKSNAECKRLRRFLASAEKERDRLRLENERLEAQQSNSLLKTKPKSFIVSKSPRIVRKQSKQSIGSSSENLASSAEHSECCCESEGESDGSQSVVDNAELGERQQHVRFNLEPSVYGSPEEADYREVQHLDKRERIYKDGRREIYYPTGTTEFINSDGNYRKFVFYNGDSKEFFPDGKMVYYYKDGTVHSTYPDGVEVYEYSNHQVDRIHPDGTKKVSYPDGHFTITYPSGAVEQHFPNGTVVKTLVDGTESIEYPSGDTETRTGDYVKHHYSNGAVKTIYKSGRVETYYPDGRLKVVDRDGNIILDTANAI